MLVGASWENRRKKKDTCATGTYHILAGGILECILHFCIFAFFAFFCIFVFLRFCKQSGCTCVAFGVFGQGSPIIINDINLPHILAICWRMNIMNEVWLAIEMKSSWRNSTAVHQSLLSLKKRPPIYLFHVAEFSQNPVFFLGSGLRARGDLGNIIQGFSPTAVQHLCGSVVKTCWWLDPSAGRVLLLC